MLLVNALKMKRKKCLCKEIFQAAFVCMCISVFLMDLCRSWILLKQLQNDLKAPQESL